MQWTKSADQSTEDVHSITSWPIYNTVVNILLLTSFHLVCYPFAKSNSKHFLTEHSPLLLLDKDVVEGPDAIVFLNNSEICRSEMAQIMADYNYCRTM